MLMLTRKTGEKIVIDDNITLTVVEIGGDRVRLGIDAPRSVSIHRKEVWDAIQRDREKIRNEDKEDGLIESI